MELFGPSPITAHFYELLECAANENPQRAVFECVDRIVALPGNLGDQRNRVNQSINYEQSIHAASVHQSISDSVRQLKRRYKNIAHEQVVKENIKKFSKWLTEKSQIAKVPSKYKYETAKQCFERIKNHSFVDPGSQVSTKELLALCWIAVHDDSVRLGSLDSAMDQLLQGLYEIQRGYNLSANGVDLGGEDLSICTGGTFNKLVEKLAGIHPDVEVIFITSETIAYRFPKLVKEIAEEYLKTLKESADSSKNLILEIINDDNGAEIIWGKIEEMVRESMLREFSVYFQGKPDNVLNEFMQSGKYVSLDDCIEKFKLWFESFKEPRVSGTSQTLFFSSSHASGQNALNGSDELSSGQSCSRP